MILGNGGFLLLPICSTNGSTLVGPYGIARHLNINQTYSATFRPLPQLCPMRSIQVSVHHATRHILAVIIHFSPLLPPQNADTKPAITPLPNLQFILDMLPPSQKWAFDYVDNPLNLHFIISAIQTHQCVAVSDGPLKESTGIAAFMLQSQHNHIDIKGVH